MLHEPVKTKRRRDDGKEPGWEDWEDDQRRALGKSHSRTVEVWDEEKDVKPREDSTSSLREERRPSSTDPKGQILARSVGSEEYRSKKRRVSMQGSVHSSIHGSVHGSLSSATGGCGDDNASVRSVESTTGSVASIVKLGNRLAYRKTVYLACTLFAVGALVAGALIMGLPDGTNIQKIENNVQTLLSNAGHSILISTTETHKERGTEPEKQVFSSYSLSEWFESFGSSSWTPPLFDGLFSSIAWSLEKVQPVFWIPFNNGGPAQSTVIDVLNTCVKVTVTSEESRRLQRLRESRGLLAGDLTQVLIASNLGHVLVTSDLVETASLFQGKNVTGRVFAFLAPPPLPEEGNLKGFNNPLVRTICDLDSSAIITNEHVLFAKHFVQDKVLIGLVVDFDNSLDRVLQYFGWKDSVDAEQDLMCVENIKAASSKHLTRQLEEIGNVTSIGNIVHWADMELYLFAEYLYNEQQQQRLQQQR